MRAAFLALPLIFALVPAPAQAKHVDEDDIKYVLPPDNIPAITDPKFDRGDWLGTHDKVIGVEYHDVARAYPLRILNWHEIADDSIGEAHFAVTYCPLCGTGIVFDREVFGQVLTFKVSGKLYRSDLVMYDTQTDSLWAQVSGEAIRGPFHGTNLEVLPSTLTTWGAWKEAHPDTVALSRDTGHRRDYDRDPYEGYSGSRRIGISGETRRDVYSIHPKEFVLGLEGDRGPMAFRYQRLAEVRVLNWDLDGTRIVVAFAGDSARAFLADDRTFAHESAGIMVDQRGERWTMLTGKAVEGDDALAEVPAVPSFWFAWYDFHPGTRVWGALGVVETTPAREARGVLPTTPIAIRFTEALNATWKPEDLVRIEPPVAGRWEVRNATLVFTPREPLANGTYRVEVSTNATDRFGNPLGEWYAFVFTVGGASGAAGERIPGFAASGLLAALGLAAVWLRRRRR